MLPIAHLAHKGRFRFGPGQGAITFPLLRRQGELTVIEVFSQNRTDPAGTRVREALAAQAELLVRIGPDGPGTESLHPLGYQDETRFIMCPVC
jgi:hypothetical protein